MKKTFKKSAVLLSAALLTTSMTFAQDAMVQTSVSATATVQTKKSFFQSLKERFTASRDQAKQTRMEIKDERKEMMENSGARGDIMMQLKQDASAEGLTIRLQAAVKAGVITQAEADKVVANRKIMMEKEAENKVILDKLMSAEAKGTIRTQVKTEIKDTRMEMKKAATATPAVKVEAGATVNVQ